MTAHRTDARELPACFGEFAVLMEARAAEGQREYGDRSLERAPGDLADEIVEELVDVAKWSALTFGRVEQLRDRLEVADRALAFVRRLRRDLVDGRTGFSVEWLDDQLRELDLHTPEECQP